MSDEFSAGGITSADSVSDACRCGDTLRKITGVIKRSRGVWGARKNSPMPNGMVFKTIIILIGDMQEYFFFQRTLVGRHDN